MNPMMGASREEGSKSTKTLWRPVVDAKSGNTYYVNRNTKETVWDKPADADQPWVKDGPNQQQQKQQLQQLPPGWKQHFDQKNQKPYYHNTETGETSWKLPTAYVLD